MARLMELAWQGMAGGHVGIEKGGGQVAPRAKRKPRQVEADRSAASPPAATASPAGPSAGGSAIAGAEAAPRAGRPSAPMPSHRFNSQSAAEPVGGKMGGVLSASGTMTVSHMVRREAEMMRF